MSTLSIVRTTLLIFVRHGIQHNILFVQVQKRLQLGKALALFSQLVCLCKRLRKLFLGVFKLLLQLHQFGFKVGHTLRQVVQAVIQTHGVADRIRAKLRPNVVLPADLQGNPEAVFDVQLLPTGDVLAVKLKKSSGSRAYDDAVERAILKEVRGC